MGLADERILITQPPTLAPEAERSAAALSATKFTGSPRGEATPGTNVIEAPELAPPFVKLCVSDALHLPSSSLVKSTLPRYRVI